MHPLLKKILDPPLPYHSCSEFSSVIVFPVKESEKKVTYTIFFNVTVDACVILN